MGRQHGGANALRAINAELVAIGKTLHDTSYAREGRIDPNGIDDLTDQDIWLEYEENEWLQAFEELGVYFSDPLDLDFAMLESFPKAYQHPNPGGKGPRGTAKALEAQKAATLKKNGDATIYEDRNNEEFRWYPYLFLGRSKPETHIAALARLTEKRLARGAPESIKSLIEHVKDNLGIEDGGE